MRRIRITGMATLVSACAVATTAGSSLAVEPPPYVICFNGDQAAESAAAYMPLDPTNGASVPAGMPVTFSGDSGQALTFSVASSPAALSSPDIDSGAGSRSGAFEKFTSAKATATPRTIYWTASFTFTPTDCESPSTFTTPVRTLVVVPSEAESSAARKRQEEEAGKKKLEEETATKKKEAETAGSVMLDSSVIGIDGRQATVDLTCADVAPCAGKLTLTAGSGKAKRTSTQSIGTAGFSIEAGARAAIKVTLGKTGRALLKAAHGHLSASLTIARTSPLPSKTQTEHVHLQPQKTAKTKSRH